MTEAKTGVEERERRLRRLVFRSWHRGMREVDLILGSFADRHAVTLTEEETDQYERLLETPDTDLLPWLTGERPVPAHSQSEILERLMAHARAMAACH